MVHHAVLVVDIDHIRMINDSLGRTAGGQAVITLAQRLQDSIRRADTLARLGGHEFAIIQGEVENVNNTE